MKTLDTKGVSNLPEQADQKSQEASSKLEDIVQPTPESVQATPTFLLITDKSLPQEAPVADLSSFLNKLILDDCRKVLPLFPSESVDLIVTSPPYADKRNSTYGGIKADKYVAWFLLVSKELKRVLKPNGSFILNIKEPATNGERHTFVLELIMALREQGWFWVEEYCWHKKNSYPGKWPNRFRDSWERCLHFTVSKQFAMYQEAVRVPMGDWAKSRLKNLSEADKQRDNSKVGSGFGKNVSKWLERDMAYPTNVIHMATECANQGHSAAFPVALPSWFIKLFTQPGDVVLDPFMGSGTTAVACLEQSRNFIGTEINEEYCNLANNRLITAWTTLKLEKNLVIQPLTSEELKKLIRERLDIFYDRRINKLSELDLWNTLKSKNPYLFRATGVGTVGEIVEELLQAYLSSSDEGIFGNAFFEHIAKKVAGGVDTNEVGLDAIIETETEYTALQIKSGPNWGNADQQKRLKQNFQAAKDSFPSKKIEKEFKAVLGICYERTKGEPNNERIHAIRSGQAFWEQITGDSNFYLDLLHFMEDYPYGHRHDYKVAWDKAVNRFIKKFSDDFADEDGNINWNKILEINSGKNPPKKPRQKKPKDGSAQGTTQAIRKKRQKKNTALDTFENEVNLQMPEVIQPSFLPTD